MSEQTERYGLFGATREEYLRDKHLVLENDGNWDFYANEDESQFYYVPKPGSTAWSGWFGDAAYFMRWLTYERRNGKGHEPALGKLKLEWNGSRYLDARNWEAA